MGRSSKLFPPRLGSNSAHGGGAGVALSNQVGDELPALVWVCETLGTAAQLAIQCGLQQIVLRRLAEDLGDHLFREVAVDAHGDQPPHHASGAAASDAHFGTRNGHRGAPVVEGAVLEKALDGSVYGSAAVAAIGEPDADLAFR